MKTTKIITAIMLAIMLLTGAVKISIAQEASKSINKEFKVNKDAILSVDNRFGKIHCNIWDKDVIKIEVVVTAKAWNAREAERMIERVDIEISGSSHKVEATTTLPGRTTTTDKSSLTVDYTISMPQTLNLFLTNKFGDIYLDNNSGTSLISLDYGNLQINSLQGNDHTLNMRFSKGTLGRADNLELNMSYSELVAREIKDIVIDSKFSTFEVGNAGTIRHDSQYDTNRLGELKSVKTKARFSTISIESITEALDLEMRYGGCTVRNIGPKFREIIINNSYSNIDLRFSPDASYQLEAKSSFGAVSFPGNSDVKVEETSFTSKSYNGVVGKESKPVRKVVIITQNGDVNLKTR